jgi:hypothetical protein
VFEGNDEVEVEDGTLYTRTPTEEWTKVDIEDGEDDGGRTIDPIEWTGEEADEVNIGGFRVDPCAAISKIYNWDE